MIDWPTHRDAIVKKILIRGILNQTINNKCDRLWIRVYNMIVSLSCWNGSSSLDMAAY